jgi:hypothetical protein
MKRYTGRNEKKVIKQPSKSRETVFLITKALAPSEYNVVGMEKRGDIV